MTAEFLQQSSSESLLLVEAPTSLIMSIAKDIKALRICKKMQYERVLEAFEHAYQLCPEDLDITAKCLVCMERYDELPDSLEQTKSVIEKLEAYQIPKEMKKKCTVHKGLHYVQWSMCYYYNEDIEEALHYAEKALGINPNRGSYPTELYKLKVVNMRN